MKNYITKHKKDGILFKAEHLFSKAGADIQLRADALKEVTYLVGLLPSRVQQEDYIKAIASVTKVSAKLIKEQVGDGVAEREKSVEPVVKKRDVFMPEWADETEWLMHGFSGTINGKETGFYFAEGGGYTQHTNFMLTPIVHIYSETPEDNVRVTELTNGFDTRVIDMPTKAFLSVMDFEDRVGGYGNFVGTNNFGKTHLNKIKVKLWQNYPLCNELKELGWQDKGFFAYSNIIYNNGLVPFNEYGVATINDINYISKSASVKKLINQTNDDMHESDKYLKHSVCDINFRKWGALMHDTYGMTGVIGAAFAMVTLFRDLVFKVDNNCPMLYAYGEAQSGKSKFAESVSNLFFNQMPAFNLNQGTDVAFWNRLMRFKNCPVQFNEFDENAIKEDWFRALKSVYDGEGRERGTIKKGKSEVQKVNCTVILMGQYLSTKDDNSVLSRCIPNAFKKQNERSDKVLKAYDELKEAEKAGLSGILCELLQHRETIKSSYASTLSEIKIQLLKALREASLVGETRIVGNYAHLLAMCKLLGPSVGFAVTYKEFFNYCFAEICKLSSMMSESNVLSDFWKSVETLLDRQLCEYGFDFRVEKTAFVTKMDGRKDTVRMQFDTETEVLYIRLNNVHTQYMQLKRSATGKTGINLQTIEMYLRDQPYYIGVCKSTSFKSMRTHRKMNTSCIMLKYDAVLQSNLIREHDVHSTVREVGDDINAEVNDELAF